MLMIFWPQYVAGLVVNGDLTQNVDLTLYEVSGVINNWDATPLEWAIAGFSSTSFGLDDLLVYAEACADDTGEYATWLPGEEYNIYFYPPDCMNLITLSAGQQLIEGNTVINFQFR